LRLAALPGRTPECSTFAALIRSVAISVVVPAAAGKRGSAEDSDIKDRAQRDRCSVPIATGHPPLGREK
jgi:hypothetical protein